ncbi:MAG: 16S rRNA (cytosine(1402)-N(4))-methyltransferase RsmH [Holosporales bacterium]|jgi:16S rRNA (cytosine1402-N4)-methyltransferase|nr:16S rRNA (cytosine(1402)-N(4))-methyltransferase RsmH [Holosporales bacterium]
MVHEVISILAPCNGNRILDCTFGGGGHTRAILNSAECYVLGTDCDPDAADRATSLKEQYRNRFDFMQCRFSGMRDALGVHEKFDAVLFDFGISSFQVDDADRGFSFMKDGALDMRMSKSGPSAFDVVNSFTEEDIAEMIRSYGDEPRAMANRIASSIINARRVGAIRTTGELREVVHKAVGNTVVRKRYSHLDPSTKTFQAIRIFVNDELREISKVLESIPYLLNDNARIVTIAFHSLEDRVVKNWAVSMKSNLSVIGKGTVNPSTNEVVRNPRARSAKLRGFVYRSNNHGGYTN